MRYIKAKKVSYGDKRSKKAVKYIVIHGTGNNNDTAIGNANYFAKNNKREAGAHIFCDRNGKIIKSIALSLTAWSVGGFYSKSNGAGKLYKIVTNSNSASIELCDIASQYPSAIQIKAVAKAIKHIQKHCPNAKKIVRHWDVNGKTCPTNMCGKDNKQWTKLKKALIKRGISKSCF